MFNKPSKSKADKQSLASDNASVASFGTVSGFVHVDEEAAICGYLEKKTKDGRWQRRWFETNGVYLTYYKSRKVEKLLAALSLAQVGDIKPIPVEQDVEHKGGLFQIELKSRIYILRAKNDEEAGIWVKVLMQVKDQGLNSHKILSKAQENVAKEALTGEAEKVSGKKHTVTAEISKTKGRYACYGCCS